MILFYEKVHRKNTFFMKKIIMTFSMKKFIINFFLLRNRGSSNEKIHYELVSMKKFFMIIFLWKSQPQTFSMKKFFMKKFIIIIFLEKFHYELFL